MTQSIIITGFGGQGILFAGKVLAYTAMLAGKYLSWLPSYGPEMRGGTANCHVIVSDEPIGSPIVTEPDILISMNQPSFDKFEESVKTGGSVIIDSSLVERQAKREDIKVKYVEATKIALDIGNSALANMVIIGAMLKQTGIFVIDEIKAGMAKAVPKSKSDMIDVNMDAVIKGYNM